jgi:polyisoprenoid-binding protein YceI
MKRRWTGLLGLFLLLSVSGRLAADPSSSAVSAVPAADEPPGTIEFVGKNLIANAQGTFHRWRVLDKQVDFSAVESSSIVIEVDLASIDTQNSRRDEHLRTADFFDVEQYPTAIVRGYGLKAIGESEAGRPRYSLSFDIELHGVKKTVQGEVELMESNPAVVEGDLEINRVDFGIGNPASRWNPMSIKEIIPIHFRLEV